MRDHYRKLATWLHSYGLWPKPSQKLEQDSHNILVLLIFIYSWMSIMSPLLAVMLVIRYLRNHNE